MSLKAETKTVTVTLLGKQYPINCPPEHETDLQKAADYLQTQIQTLHHETKNKAQSLDGLLVMLCLNLTHDLLTEQARHGHELLRIEDKIQQLQDHVDRKLANITKPIPV